METIRPGIVTKYGDTIYPTGVEWLLAFAIKGCEWAVKALDELEKKKMALDDHTIKGEIVDSAVPCAFINSYGPPEKIGPWLAFRVVEREESWGGPKKLYLSGTRQYTYRHPEAPDAAVITVLMEDMITEAKQSDPEYGVLYGLMQAENAVKFLLKEKIKTAE